mmetsp:Transcript_19839/g.41593  ORF Transcript_19839/g.41593 Transcript_19839/m.41593 type:complete len:93 (-) Transcript_19839:200-478(-)
MGGSKRDSSTVEVGAAPNDNEGSTLATEGALLWPSSLIGKEIDYEVPLKSKTTGINIRKATRKIMVKLVGKSVAALFNEEEAEQCNTIKLLD